MAIYTATLSQNHKGLAAYESGSVQYSTNSGTWRPSRIAPPEWKSGAKQFRGYYYSYHGGDTLLARSDGSMASYLVGNVSATERWTTLVFAAVVKDGSSNVLDIPHDGGVWYSDFQNRVPFDGEHPIPLPQKELHRFLGCYSTNGTTGTKYINSDGTPTAEFLALSPTADIPIYAQFELASVKVTISDSYGTYAYKAFYQSVTADAGGAHGFYSESSCAPESRIYGIPVPMRELYAWGGLRSASTSSGVLYVDANGDFTDAFLSLSGGDVRDRTIYAVGWTQASHKVTVAPQGGEAPSLTYYVRKTAGGVFSDWLCATPELDSLPIPTRTGYRFLGYYDSTSSSATQYADADGVVQSALRTRTATTTVYAQWRPASATVTLDPNGGVGGGALYYDATGGVFFDATSAAVSTVEIPTYTGNVFLGYFDAQTGGGEVIGSSGEISTSFRPTSSATLYAHWSIGKSAIDVERREGEGGTERFYYDHAARKFYADADLTEEIESVVLPVLRLFGCEGLFTESSEGNRVVTQAGVISPSWSPSDENVTVYAHYARRCHEMAVDAGDGAASPTSVFHAPGDAEWFSDEFLSEPVSEVAVSRTGYNFLGCSYGGATVVSAAGEILPDAALDEDYTATAAWGAKTYTLAFDAGAVTPSFTSKTVTFGSPVGLLPTAADPKRMFDGWMLGSELLAASTVWSLDGDATAIAAWRTNFGNVTDYFKLASAALVPIASESGDNRERVTVSHTGKWESGVDAVSGVWRNPSVTYMVVADTRLNVTLGKAFSGVASSNVSGYMIVSVKVSTSLASPPTVTVAAVANEGADAINQFRVRDLAVSARHRPQNLDGAVSGGGELLSLDWEAKCDPVVIAEFRAGKGMMPCASDVVHGTVTARATTAAYDGEVAPTAGLNYTALGAPTSEDHVGYRTYSIETERGM